MQLTTSRHVCVIMLSLDRKFLPEIYSENSCTDRVRAFVKTPMHSDSRLPFRNLIIAHRIRPKKWYFRFSLQIVGNRRNNWRFSQNCIFRRIFRPADLVRAFLMSHYGRGNIAFGGCMQFQVGTSRSPWPAMTFSRGTYKGPWEVKG